MNDQKFFYMGDPTMRLQFPPGYASIDSINQQPSTAWSGFRRHPGADPPLSRVTVAGSVRKQDNAIDDAFNGTMTLRVNDATRRQIIVNFYPGVNWSYVATGGTIYRGENSVPTAVSATFIVPGTSFADSTARGRMLAYFSKTPLTGQGSPTISDRRDGFTFHNRQTRAPDLDLSWTAGAFGRATW